MLSLGMTLCTTALLALCSSASFINTTVWYSPSDSTYTVSTQEQTGWKRAASVTINNTVNVTGWDDVRITTNTDLPRDVQYYAAGYGEGYTTVEKTFYLYQNTVLPGMNNVTGWGYLVWIEQHIAYLQLFQVSDPDPFRSHVALYMRMLQGISDGYTAKWKEMGAPPALNLTFYEIFLLNFQPEIGDTQTATGTSYWANVTAPQWLIDKVTEMQATAPTTSLTEPHSSVPVEMRTQTRQFRYPITAEERRKDMMQHCSALVRVTKDDLFLAHDTWSTYDSMLRQYKTYTLDGVVISLSGYAGTISSTDDWYMTSNYLAVTETTNSVYNTSLYEQYTVPTTVSEFLRVMVANVLATDGESWNTYFSMQNSGTYCNQWIVADMKRFTPGEDIVDGTLWVIEQLPGLIIAQDVSSILQKQGFWSSYNIPYFKRIYDLSENALMESMYGSFYSYTNYSRAEIFRRDAPKVQSLEDMQHVMRYNDYTSDPFSLIPNCTGAINNTCNPPYNPCLTIACRADLAPVYATNAQGVAAWGYQWQNFIGQAFGAIDTKIASYQMMSRGELLGVVISGPTAQSLPPFQWSANDYQWGSIPLGQPNLFNFPFVNYSVAVPIMPPRSHPHRISVVGIGLGCLAGVFVVVLVGYKFCRKPGAEEGYKELQGTV